MYTSDAKSTVRSKSEENSPLYFGEWLRSRRRELDLTQEQLAKRTSCSVFTIRKIETGERRPSRQLAGLLAQSLEIPPADQAKFIKVARGELSMERLASPARAPSRDFQPASRPGAIPASLPRVSLPRGLTPFLGREAELSRLGQLLVDPQCLLLTIVGPGGIGKTRLAIEAADQSQDRFPDGVWFVALAALNSPALLVPAIADALNFRSQDPADLQAELLQYLREKRALIILDNAEHLLDGAGLLAKILDTCPQVKLLVTSRERINLLSEWVFEILGLPVPANDSADQLEAYSAVALFLQSARRVRAGFELRQEDRPFVIKICQLLEGLPLGIELSAAWVGLLPCDEIAREIERNIDFLTVSIRDLPERQRSLRATLDYSWKLLNAEEQAILTRLSVFHGSFRREAAYEICGASLPVLSALRDKMLLYRTGEDFYSLHELIRQYTELKLRQDPEEDERVKDRHSAYYVRCLAEWEQALKSSRQIETFQEMAQVVNNLSRGWQRMVTSFGPQTLENSQFRPDLFHRSLFSLSLFYEMHNRSPEGVALFSDSVAYLKSIQNEFEKKADSTVFSAVLGHVTAYLGLHHYYLPQVEQACAYLEEAIKLLEIGQATVIRAQVMVMLAATYAPRGLLKESIDLLEQSRKVFHDEGDRWWYLLASINISPAYISIGKLEVSEAYLQEGLGLLEPGDFRLGMPLRVYYAYLQNLKKDYAKAEQLMQENLQLCYLYGTLGQTASTLFELGRIALATERIELAEEYIQRSINTLKEYGQVVNLAMHRLYLGKCFAARRELTAALDQYKQVVQIGHEKKTPHMLYWGLISIAWTYKQEGKTEKALEIALALRNCPVQYIKIKEEGDHLLADLQTELPLWQVEAAMKKVDSKIIPDPSGATALAYAYELV